MPNTLIVPQSFAEDLRLAIKDLTRVNPWVGLLRLTTLVSLLVLFVSLAWLSDNLVWFGINTVIAGYFYALCLICTHDTAHHTLTGWRWFEEIVARLLSYPALWPYGTYSEFHHLHHGWNGRDFRDPERVQWTEAEYRQASPLLQWYVRHQWLVDIFVFGGVGLNVKSIANGLRLQSVRPHLRWQLAIDLLGMLVIQSILLWIVVNSGLLWRYLIFLLVLERSTGFVLQIREHLEHYRLWSQQEGYQLTQLYSCRNLKVNALTQWLMGGLPYHSVHHCFPDLPFNNLPEAFERIQSVLKKHNLPLMSQDPGYLQSTWQLLSKPAVISNIKGGHRDLTEDAKRSPLSYR